MTGTAGAEGRRKGNDTLVVLFNRDLRVHDHPALSTACRQAGRVVPLFVLDPAVPGRPPASANRLSFLLESLADLRHSLRARGGDLFCRKGDVVEETMAVVDQVDACGVWVSDDVGVMASVRQERLARACADQGRDFRRFPGVAVVPPGELVPAGKDHYAVFTPYWARWHAHAWRRPVRAPARVVVPRALPRGALAPGPTAAKGPVSPGRQHGGEAAGRALASRWLRRWAPRYDDIHDDLAGDHTSHLSAFLHFGCVSPLELAHRANGHEPFVRQLCWRDFHLQVNAAFPALARRDYRHRGHRWRRDPAALEAWKEGRTGIPVVDAAMRQLRSEGFIHNRARMLAAAYLVKDLGVDWRFGAAHFMDWLTDADVANNAGNWQWIAGTGNDTRPNRRFNLLRQALRHDPDGAYVRRYVPELAAIAGPAVHQPWRLPSSQREGLGYPDPLWGRR